MKKSKKILLIILLFFVIPLSITSLFSEFIYYTKGLEYSLNGDTFGSILKPFTFSDYVPNPDYQNKEDGSENESAQDSIIGDDSGIGSGLTNPDSLINENLTMMVLPDSNFITSIDSAPMPCKVSGQDHRLHLGVSPEINFAIYREKASIDYQIWKVYTTKYPIDYIKPVDYISTNNGIKPVYNTKFIENIYCTTYKWVPDFIFSSKGKYQKQGQTTIGYSPIAINQYNNPNKLFFDPKSYVINSYIKPNSIDIVKLEGQQGQETETIISNKTIQMNPGDVINLKGKINPSNATDDTIMFSSEDESIAHITNSGKLTAISKGTTNIIASTANALSNKDYPKTASFKVNIGDGFVKMPKFIDITSDVDPVNNKYYLGSNYKLNAKVTAADHKTAPINEEVIWSSSDITLATVDKFGNVSVNDALYPQSVTITAVSSIDKSIKRDFIMSLNIPKADPSINGSNVYKDGNIETGVEKNQSISAKNINTVDMGYVYPDTSNVQILKGNAENNDNQAYLFNVSIESLDPNAQVSCYFEKSNSYGKKKFTMSSKDCIRIDKTHYQIRIPKNTSNTNLITVIKANKPVKYSIQYAGIAK